MYSIFKVHSRQYLLLIRDRYINSLKFSNSLELKIEIGDNP